ncbi:helix-turn-helix domain-containing protein [Leucobacter sp. NPDC058333]|uniref:helix-turn-helix domain-containing protein n=1 Tax=Leucobacter sp. NPDC058333 TaxID=3346450 RepID=UPI003669F214
MSLAVSAELRAELARKGFNVQSFARHSNLPVSTLHKTLKGLRVVDVEDLFAICEALDLDPGALVDRAAMEARRRWANGVLVDFEDENVGGQAEDDIPHVGAVDLDELRQSGVALAADERDGIEAEQEQSQELP